MKKLLVLLGVALVCLTGCGKRTRNTMAFVSGNDLDYVRDEHIEALSAYVDKYYDLDMYAVEVDWYNVEYDALSVQIIDGSDEAEIGCLIDEHYSVACLVKPYN